MTDYEKNLFETRYRKDETETSWNDIFRRVANTIGKNKEKRNEYYSLMADGYFLPSSPQMFNFGTDSKQGSSCFTMKIEDTLEGIYQADWESAQIYKNSGGCGYNLSSIRPRGSLIHKSNSKSAGITPVLERLERTSAYISYGNRSRGALMCQLDISHPDVIEFILCKKPIQIEVDGILQFELPLQNVNISVRVTDDFIEAMDNNKNWKLEWSDEKQTFSITTWEEWYANLKADTNLWKDVKQQRFIKYSVEPLLSRFKGKIKAKQLWDLISESAHGFADPGIVFVDNAEKYNPHPQLGKLFSNPCQPEFAKVLTPDGIREFKDIDVGSVIWSTEGWTTVINKWNSGLKDVYKYTTETGAIFEGTQEHLVMSGGVKTEVGKTDGIDVFIFLRGIFQGIEKSLIISKEYLGKVNVYDIEVDNSSHTYWTNGCNVSNCSEFLGPSKVYSSCNLGSMNLRRFFIDGSFDWQLYGEKVALATEYLNDVLDYNEAPIKQINIDTKQVTRPIGLGIMKLADLLILEKIRYGSEEAIEYSKTLMAFTNYIAWETSFQLAKNKPVPTSWDSARMKEIFYEYCKNANSEMAVYYDRLIDLIENGSVATNTVVTSNAPTGSIAQICNYVCNYTGESSGIEPIFSWETYRKDASGSTVIKHDLASDKKEEWHVIADEVTPEEHVKMQAAIAMFTSMSVSKTINMPENASVKDVSDAYLLAYELGIKGTTVYRDKSKPIQVLSSLDKEVKEIKEDFKVPEIPDIRPDRQYGYTEKVETANGSIYVTINKQLNESDYKTVREILQDRGKITEIFGSHGKSGTDIAGYMQTICRQASYMLRKAKAPVDDVLKQLRGVSFSPSWHKGRLIMSPVDAIAHVIERELDLKNKKVKKEIKSKSERCAICGQEFRYTDGCKSCGCGAKCG
jgi:ribonucleotide reductase alpha subunit